MWPPDFTANFSLLVLSTRKMVATSAADLGKMMHEGLRVLQDAD